MKVGFPEAVLLEASDHQALLRDYVTTVVLKDIVERYKVTNVSVIYIVKTMIHNAGCSLSVHKLHNDLNSQGMVVGKNTLHDYLAHIEDAYLAFRVPIFAESLRVMDSNPTQCESFFCKTL